VQRECKIKLKSTSWHARLSEVQCAQEKVLKGLACYGEKSEDGLMKANTFDERKLMQTLNKGEKRWKGT